MSAPHPDGQTNRLQQIFNEPSRLPRAHAERAFMVIQVWIAASLNCFCRPRLPFGGGVQTISRSNQIDNDLRYFKLSL